VRNLEQQKDIEKISTASAKNEKKYGKRALKVRKLLFFNSIIFLDAALQLKHCFLSHLS
jgi:hypothetical protein